MIYLLISIFLYATNNFLWKFQLNQHTGSSLVWGRSFFTSIFALLTLVFFSDAHLVLFEAINADGLLFLLSASLGGLGLFAMIKGLESNNLGIFAFYQMLISIFSGAILSTFLKLQFSALIGGILILSAFSIVSFRFESKSLKFSKSHLWLMLMSIAFTLLGFTNWKLVSLYPPIISVCFQEVSIFIALSLWFRLQGSDIPITIFKKWKMLAFFALIIFSATYFSAKGLNITNPLVLSLLGLLVPVVTTTMGVLFLKEKLTWRLPVAFLLIGVGIYILLKL